MSDYCVGSNKENQVCPGRNECSFYLGGKTAEELSHAGIWRPYDPNDQNCLGNKPQKMFEVHMACGAITVYSNTPEGIKGLANLLEAEGGALEEHDLGDEVLAIRVCEMSIRKMADLPESDGC